MKPKRIHDFILIAVLLAVFILGGIFAGTFTKTAANTVVILSENKTVYEGRLFTDQTIEVNNSQGGKNTVQIKNARVSVTHANCPDQICTHTQLTEGSWMRIICLPNELIVFLNTESTPTTDVVL